MKNAIIVSLVMCAAFLVSENVSAEGMEMTDVDELSEYSFDTFVIEDLAELPYTDFEDSLLVPFSPVSASLSSSGSGGASPLSLSYGGSCEIEGNGTPANPYQIVCTNYGEVGEGLRYLVGQQKDNDKIIACRSEDSGSTWELDGWADMSTIDRLLVYGSDESSEVIGFKLVEGTVDLDEGCVFDDFPSQFTDLSLIDGQSGADQVYGGPYGDYLVGEYVQGYEGADTIHITDDNCWTGSSYFAAYGNEGVDHIYASTVTSYYTAVDCGDGGDYFYGSSVVDYVWGQGGSDQLRGYGGIDRLAGGDDNDYVYGGNDRDYLWGGSGNDHLYGDDDSGAYDIMYGMDGDDYLHDTGNSICDGGGNATALGDGCECGSETNCEY